MDGLFIDSEPMHWKAWNLIAQKYGLEISKNKYHDFVGKGSTAVTNWIRENGEGTEGITHEDLEKEKIKNNEKLYHMAQVRRGAKKLALEMKNKYKIGMASTSRKNTVKSLQKETDTENLFEVSVGGDEAENIKPAPDIYLLAAKKLGVNPEKCVALEDSPTGVEAANNADMISIAVPNNYTRGRDFSHADFVADSFEEAKAFIKSLNS